MKIVKTGLSRTVYLTKKNAYKVPTFRNGLTHFLLGWVSNQQEKQWSGYKSWLCPVERYYLWGFVIRMPRLKIGVGKREIEGMREMMGELDKELFGSDHKTDNYGKMDGKIMKVDYGVFYNSPIIKGSCYNCIECGKTILNKYTPGE